METVSKNLDFGIIGNCRSAALINKFGSLDWACLPDFDSFSCFAKLLDKKKGGHCAIRSKRKMIASQNYIADTNILRTEFNGTTGSFELLDFMPRYHLVEGGYHCPPDILRILRPLKDAPKVAFEYRPRLCYGKHRTFIKKEDHSIKAYTRKGAYESVYLYSNLTLEVILENRYFELSEPVFFWISYNQKILKPTLKNVFLELEKTKVYWMEWARETTEFPKYNSVILRSALCLKLLTYQKTGAILAAVTTSLPETIGQVRNWDYRFCWIRDASMIISVLRRLGHTKSAKRYLNFILDVIPYKDPEIQIMYGINGEKNLKENKLEWMSGYLGSKPVRVGNAAYKQKQNDIYGVLVDVIYQNLAVFKSRLDESEHLWTVVRALVRKVESHWKKPDRGLWEFRSFKQHFVFSKVLCWVAADRGAKIAALLGRMDYATRWKSLAKTIKTDVLKSGWNEKVQCFTQSYGSEHTDAANLLMESYGFIAANDPLFVKTVERTYTTLCKDGLVYRYLNNDDFGIPSSSFTICTFWMIKSLYVTGKKELAEKMFKKILSYGNHLSLFSEDIDFKTKRLLGNFPQGYSHLALIDTAITLGGGSLNEELRIKNLFETLLA